MRIVIAGGTKRSREVLARGLEHESHWKVVGRAHDSFSGFRSARECGADALLVDRSPGDPLNSAVELPIDGASFAIVTLVDVPAGHAHVSGLSVTKGASMRYLRDVISQAVRDNRERTETREHGDG